MDSRLKQRLVGAAVFGIIALVGVPLILGEPQRRGPPAGAAPAPRAVPDAGFNSSIQPLNETAEGMPIQVPAPVMPAAAATAPAAAAAAPSQPVADTNPPVRPRPRPPLVNNSAPAQAPAPAASPLPSDPPVTGQFLVQLASFSSQENALKLRDALRAKGHDASVVTSEDKVHHRLFVGPYADREQADQAIGRLRAATGLTGVVRRGDRS